MIGDEHVNVGDWTYERRRNRSQFTGISDDNDFLGLADHGTEGERFFGFDYRYTAARINSADAHEHFVHVDVVQEVDRGMTNQGEGSRPLDEASGHEGPQTLAIAQLHCDVHSIRNDAYIVAISQAASHVGGGGAGSESDGFVLLNEFRRRQTDTPLVRDPVLLAVLKQRVVAKGFVQQRFDQGGSARSSPDESLHLELGQVPADAGRGCVQPLH